MPLFELLAWIIVIAYVAAFLLLTAMTARTARRSLWLFGKGEERQTVPALLFRLAFAGAVIWPGIKLALDRTLFSLGRGERFSDSIGAILALLGASVALGSQIYMRQSWRIGAAVGELGAMVTSGPFRYSRNPVFVGQAWLFLGLLVAIPDPVQAMITLALFLAIRWQVLVEERVLAATFGDAYAAYCKAARRWV